jgi:hypothetical protein
MDGRKDQERVIERGCCAVSRFEGSTGPEEVGDDDHHDETTTTTKKEATADEEENRTADPSTVAFAASSQLESNVRQSALSL